MKKAAALLLSLFILGAQTSAAQEPAKDDVTYSRVKSLLKERLQKAGNGAPSLTDSILFLEQQIISAIEAIRTLQDENETLRIKAEGLASELTDVSEERHEVVDTLHDQVSQLADLLQLEKNEVAGLQTNLDTTQSELSATIGERDQLNQTMNTLLSERDQLDAELAILREERDRLYADLATARALASSQSTQMSVRSETIDGLKARMADMQARLADRVHDLDQSRLDIDQLRKDLITLRAKRTELQKLLNAERQRLKETLAQAEGREDELLARLENSQTSLDDEKTVTAEAKRGIDRLNRQIAALREQLAALNVALEASEAVNKEQKVAIVDLGTRLNQALATKVAELARYRSEFFGRLREVLGNRQDLQVVGDRFVFQSEVLFASGEAALGSGGKVQLRRFARTLREIAATIPDGMDWVLRVDGHTDVRPIHTERFPSNWELSTARATSVVKFLINEAIPGNRLVAAGFGSHHPLDARKDEIGYRRNRRIEFKLTQR